MVLNYHSTNYTGWPIPASYYATKVQKISESCKFLSNYFPKNIKFFTKPSSTFSMAFEKVLGGFVARNA